MTSTVSGRSPHAADDSLDQAIDACAKELARQAALAEYVGTVQLYKAKGYDDPERYAATVWRLFRKPARYIIEAIQDAGFRITSISDSNDNAEAKDSTPEAPPPQTL